MLAAAIVLINNAYQISVEFEDNMYMNGTVDIQKVIDQVLPTHKTRSDASIGHVRINEQPFGGCHAKAKKSEEVSVHGQADQFNFCLELEVSTWYSLFP